MVVRRKPLSKRTTLFLRAKQKSEKILGMLQCGRNGCFLSAGSHLYFHGEGQHQKLFFKEGVETRSLRR